MIALVAGCGSGGEVSTGTNASTVATISPTTDTPSTILETSSSPSTTSSSVAVTTSSSTSTTNPTTSTTSAPPPSTTPADVSDPETFAGSIAVPAGEIEVGPDDLFVLHVDGDLWLHPGILGASPAAAFRIADLGDPRDPVEEGPGPNAVDHVAGVVNGTVIYSDCCEPVAGNVLGATGAESERIHLLYGYSPKFSPDRTKLVSANDYALTVIELSTGEMTGRVLNNDSARYINVWDVSWAGDSSVVLLFFDDDGFALLPSVADAPFDSGPAVPLGVAFDPDTRVHVQFAGHGPNGEIAVTVADDASTSIRFFDHTTLAELPEQQRVLPAGVESVRLASDGLGLLWIDDEQLWYLPAGGEPRSLGTGFLAAWFAT